MLSIFSNTSTIHADFKAISATTAFMIIDLSDTASWPHDETGMINIEYLDIEVDPDASFVGEVKFGFVENVDATNGDFCQFADIDLVEDSGIVIDNMSFGRVGLRCASSHWFGPTTANSTLLQTDANLQGPDGATSYPSGNGDMVLLVIVSAGQVDVSVTLGYEATA